MSEFSKSVPQSKLPVHVAIIMDGNGRWAKERGISRLEGHRRGVTNVRSMVEVCARIDISYLTLFAFSSENWRRPRQEVQWLMQLLSGALEREVQELHSNDIRVSFIGDLSGLSNAIQRKIENAIELTAENSKLHLTIALNYGGRWDMAEACRKIVQMALNDELNLDELSSGSIRQCLSTANIPDPDLFIRTGGEKRMSNFMLWQLAYTELYFTDVHWPDFDENELMQALQSYASRVRRFGGIVAELE